MNQPTSHRCAGFLLALLAASAMHAAPTLGTAASSSPGQDPGAWMRAMGAAAASLSDYTMTLHKQEWIDGEGMSPEEVVEVKWARGERYYFKKLRGSSKGREVLFRKGWNDDRLRVSLNTWPNVKLNLDPYGKLAMDGLNRPIDETSLVYLVDTVLKNALTGERRADGTMTFVGRETALGRRCVKLDVRGPARAGSWYTAEPGENMLDIARKLGHAVRTISHANSGKGAKDIYKVEAGDRIYVPRYYASRIELWIDDETRLPVRALIYDDNGVLFERYEHRDLKINVGLREADFSPENPSYNF
jgi:hypothetical protein